jgi:putative transposase
MPSLSGRKLYYLTKPMLNPHRIKYGRDKLFEPFGREGLLITKRKQYTKTANSQHWMLKYPNLAKDMVPSRLTFSPKTVPQ